MSISKNLGIGRRFRALSEFFFLATARRHRLIPIILRHPQYAILIVTFTPVRCEFSFGQKI